MPVRNRILRAAATTYCNCFTLSEQFMKCIITHKSTFSKDKAISNETGPALIHNFRLHLWHKVECFCTHDFEDIALPGLKVWCVAYQEEEDIFLRFLRKPGWFTWMFVPFLFGLFGFSFKAPEVVVLACLFGGLLILFFTVFISAQQQMMVYVFLNRKGRVQETFDFSFAVIELVFSDALGMDADLLNHTARGVLEVGIVLEEVGMAEDVCSYKGIL